MSEHLGRPFNRSFEQLCEWLHAIVRGTDGVDPPASILLLGGDVHCSSIHEIDLGTGPSCRVHQLVCSPFRNPLAQRERRTLRATSSRLSEQLFARLAKLAGVEAPSASWAPIRTVTFDNAHGELVLEGRTASATIRRSPREGEDPDQLVAEPPVELAGDAADGKPGRVGSPVGLPAAVSGSTSAPGS
jgi:hypothetical protein